MIDIHFTALFRSIQMDLKTLTDIRFQMQNKVKSAQITAKIAHFTLKTAI